MRASGLGSVASGAVRRTAVRLRRRLNDDKGVAAVEFALIAPVMIGLYLSTVITTQAYMASRKVALVARSLADVASRQLAGTAGCTPTNSGNPCLANTDMTKILDAGALIMAPYSISSLKMTLSRIDIVQDTQSTPKLWAFTKWSVTYNGSLARPCNGGNTSFNATTSPQLHDDDDELPELPAGAVHQQRRADGIPDPRRRDLHLFAGIQFQGVQLVEPDGGDVRLDAGLLVALRPADRRTQPHRAEHHAARRIERGRHDRDAVRGQRSVQRLSLRPETGLLIRGDLLAPGRRPAQG